MTLPAHHIATAVLAMVCTAAACGSDGQTTTSARSTTSDAADPATTPQPSSTTPSSTVAPSTTTASTTAPSTTVSPTTAPSTTAPPTRGLAVPIPPGSFAAGPTDLYVLALDGDLELWSDTRTQPPAHRTTVADYPDPFGTVTEGPGPNVIADVAGEIGGSVVFTDCCEPVAGNVRAAMSPGDVRTIGVGSSITRSPGGDLLGTANGRQISQTSTRDEGEGTVRFLDQDPSLRVADLAWSSNATATATDDHLVLLGWTLDGGWALYDVDRTTLEPEKVSELGIPPVPEAPDVDVRFAGTGPDGEIVVAESNAETTRLRHFSPTTLTELPTIERSLPATATSIRMSRQDLMWVDRGDVLYFLPGGTLEPVRLGGGVLAAWFP